jgi:hypothetical protein
MYDNELLKNLKEQKKAFDEAQSSLDSASWAFMESVKPFSYDDKAFWTFVSALVKQIHSSCFGVSAACHNVFCYWPEDKLIDAFRSIKTIGELKGSLYHPLFDMEWNKGDDGYGDMLDAMFLAGPAIISSILNKEYDTADEIKHDVRTTCGEKIYDLIFNGESYFHSTLEEKSIVWIDCLREDQDEVPVIEEKVHISPVWHENF